MPHTCIRLIARIELCVCVKSNVYIHVATRSWAGAKPLNIQPPGERVVVVVAAAFSIVYITHHILFYISTH